MSTLKRSYRYCFVPSCKNTTISTPDKLFFSVPQDEEKRKKWYIAAQRLGTPTRTNFSICQDHFNIREDMENYVRFALTGAPVKLKADAVPRYFDTSKRKRADQRARRDVEKRRHRAELDGIMLEPSSGLGTLCSPNSTCRSVSLRTNVYTVTRSRNFNLDLSGGDAGTIMVNPNSVMPHSSVIRSLTPNNNNPTLGSTTMMTTTTTTTTTGTGKGPTKTKTKMTRRHFSFSSSNKNEMVKEERIEIEEDPEIGNEEDNDQYENDITETEEDEEEDSEEEQQEEEEEEEEAVEEDEEIIDNGTKFIDSVKTKQQQLNITVNSLKSHVAHVTNGKITQSLQKINNPLAQIRVRNFKILQATSPNLVTSPQSNNHVRKQIYNNNVHHHHLHHHHHHVNAASTTTGLASVTMAAGATTTTTTTTAAIKRDIDITEFDEKPYPKPAYSYSCLIAMALKNSQTGSLPVSEIYNFMCEHFPYFKTAPNGWKNSVRHNLSLNKCFEKIEKPAGNGNQRKGCLWAINPAKIAKMDEEVSKWSRKDPLAIKKAMIYPDHLELLERGEMKYAGTGSDISEETESSSDEATEAMSPTYGEELALGHVAANSVTDSYDESSQDCDVDVAEHHLYDEIDIEEDNKEAFHMQLNITKQQEEEQPPFAYELSPSAKRQKTLTGTLQGNYVYQTVTTSRRKTPLLVRAAANTGTFLKIE